MSTPTIPAAPEGYNTVNPVIFTQDARQVIEFVKEVFGGVEIPEALTFDTDGLIFHSEVKVGNSILIVADRKPDWAFMPSLLQIYVNDADETLSKAQGLGATVVTRPTEYLDVVFARIQDAWGNLWWVYQYLGEAAWEAFAASQEPDENSEDASWSESGGWKPSPEAAYIHDTLIEAMANLGKIQ